MEITEAGTSTNPQKKYSINTLAQAVGISGYFSEDKATTINKSGEDI